MLQVSNIVNTIFTSRTYILSLGGSTEFWLVDCGDVQPLLERMRSIAGKGFTVKGVLLTHAHYDHIYGLPQLTVLYPQLKVYTNEAGKRALMDVRMNMSKYHDDPICYSEDNVVLCDEGTKITLFAGVSAKVYATPGHNPSCLCYEVGDYLFTGDAYIPGVKVVTSLPGGDKTKATSSIGRILILAEGKIVCQGHEM